MANVHDTMPLAKHADPCPFCGEKHDLRFHRTLHFVFCNKCRAYGPDPLMEYDKINGGDEREAVRRWNNRSGK